MPASSSVAYEPSSSMTLDLEETYKDSNLEYFLNFQINHDKEDETNVPVPNPSSEPSSEYLQSRPQDEKKLLPHTLVQAQEGFIAVQKWEGYVSHVGKDTFEATLVCLKGEGPDQYAEFSFDVVSEDDQALISLGAVFYWTIGYREKVSGRVRDSLIRFRRLMWTRQEVKTFEARAKELENLFDVG